MAILDAQCHIASPLEELCTHATMRHPSQTNCQSVNYLFSCKLTVSIISIISKIYILCWAHDCLHAHGSDSTLPVAMVGSSGVATLYSLIPILGG